jgi:hypothetical protein
MSSECLPRHPALAYLKLVRRGTIPMRDDEAYAVTITASDPERKIVAIKRIREITGLGLAAAKSLVENLPSVIMDGLFAAQAAELCNLLTSVGMRVERQVDSANPPTLKNLKQMSFDSTDDTSVPAGGEIRIPIEGGGYLTIRNSRSHNGYT